MGRKRAKRKIAVVLFNLGAPDSLRSVKPFLVNLFSDPAIVGLPDPFRFVLARLIAQRRAPVAREIYGKLGGASPLFANTRRQAKALETLLKRKFDSRVFIAMRYWHPLAGEVAREVKKFGPDAVVLIPLYPQFSTTTTASSLKDWERAARATGVEAPTTAVCCYPRHEAFIAAHAAIIVPHLKKALKKGKVRVLFSAHGLPEKTIRRGDPYQWQVEQTVARVVEKLRAGPELKGARFDHAVCYQSRVGPLTWIGPSIEDEIARAGRDRVNIVLVPVSFVSEHSETLVELDMKYRAVAGREGVPGYFRTPALGEEKRYIACLAELVESAVSCQGIGPAGGRRICPEAFSRCPCKPGDGV